MLFTVITINYNNHTGLRQTIESVVSQTFNDFEYIIIDGGSTDGSVDVIMAYRERVNFWLSEEDRGIYHAMNKGVARAHGEYCIFMNSGDRFYDKDVLLDISKYQKNEDVIVGNVSIDDEDHIISPHPEQGNLTFYHLYSGAIPHQGTFIKTELLQKYPYDENLKISSDWKFFVQTLIFDNCSVCFLDKLVAYFDLNGLSSTNPNLMREEKEEILSSMLPPRILADYKRMKQSECLIQELAPQLRISYRVDKFLYFIGKFMLKFRRG